MFVVDKGLLCPVLLIQYLPNALLVPLKKHILNKETTLLKFQMYIFPQVLMFYKVGLMGGKYTDKKLTLKYAFK